MKRLVMRGGKPTYDPDSLRGLSILINIGVGIAGFFAYQFAALIADGGLFWFLAAQITVLAPVCFLVAKGRFVLWLAGKYLTPLGRESWRAKEVEAVEVDPSDYNHPLRMVATGKVILPRWKARLFLVHAGVDTYLALLINKAGGEKFALLALRGSDQMLDFDREIPTIPLEGFIVGSTRWRQAYDALGEVK